ncbi:MAG: PepSY domain-containing protein [Pseudolabrys sp.]
MSKISSFKIAAGMFGAATLIKLSVFAFAVMMLGLTTSAQAGSLGRPCTTAPQSQWLSIKELQAKTQSKATDLKEESQAKLSQTLEELRNKKQVAADKLNKLESA